MASRAQTSRSRSWAAAAESVLERSVIKAVLSIAIIASLIPSPVLEGLDPLFLVIFAVEFAVRTWAFVSIPVSTPVGSGLGTDSRSSNGEPRRRRLGTVVLLVLDLLALASFLPLSVDKGARWLRLFRLTRIGLLVGYWAPLVRDLWSIMARWERSRQVVLMGCVVAGLSFMGAVVLYHLGENTLDVTDDGVVDAADRDFVALLWWSFRQVQDPGNMLSSPIALPVVVTSVILTVFGLFLVSFLIGLGTDVVAELLELSRLRPPGLRGHTVIVNISPSTRRLLHELMRYYRKLFPTDARPLSRSWFSDLRKRGFFAPRYVVVGNDEEPPDFLRQPELTRIVYRQRGDDEEELIKRTDLGLAKRIVLLADLDDVAPDAETIRTLVTLVERVRDRERHERHTVRRHRKRVVIAEILDESNVPAAQAALATGGESFRGFVVPTEKLLALFVASLVRRPGLGVVLEELLTSHGHEIYTCFWDTPGLSFSMEQAPALPPDGGLALDGLLARGLAVEERDGMIVPLGLIVGRDHVPGQPDFDVWLNPGPEAPRGPYRGFVAVASSFRAVREFASSLSIEPERAAPAEPFSAPVLEPSWPQQTTRVLVCGFRQGSIYLLEELFRSDPPGEALVLVEDEAIRDAVIDALRAHTDLVTRGLLHGRHGTFTEQPDGSFRFDPGPRYENVHSTMYLHVADWMASRHLVNLPSGFGHVADLHAVVFVASDRRNADKRTTTALLKLEQLFAHKPVDQRPRVVAEVIDGKLAGRLEQRCEELGLPGVRVFSIQELRSYFLFQAVVVPGFDGVYAELLGAWGQSLVHERAPVGQSGPCSFRSLALHLRSRGRILVAVEIVQDGRPRICVTPEGDEPGARFDLSELRGVWVVGPDATETQAEIRVIEEASTVAGAQKAASSSRPVLHEGISI